MDDFKMIKIGIGIVGLFVAIFIIFALLPFTVIDAGERGVVMKTGKVQDYVLGEGLHFRTPIQDEIKIMNVKTRTTEIRGEGGSFDSQEVTFVAKINWRLNPDTVNLAYQEKGDESAVEQAIILALSPDSIKDAMSKFKATELLGNRESARLKALEILKKRVGKIIIIEDIALDDIKFRKEFNDAIEAKVTAEQEALAQKNKLESVKYQAQQKIESAKAEAESIRIQTEALSQNQNLIELRKADALFESAKKGVKIVPDTILSDQAASFFNVN